MRFCALPAKENTSMKKTDCTLVFAWRNIKELLRSPISWGFGIALPIVIFIIMQVIVNSIGAEAAAHVPMFAVERFTGGAVIFAASFLSLFCAMLISGDRSQSFLPRLLASPMKSKDYVLGYMLGVAPIAVVQVVVTFVVALCFGLTPTPYILVAMLFSLLFSLLFIAIGMILGSLLSNKNAPPLCSAVVQVAVMLSGMWFDLDMIGGGFSLFCHILPFAHGYDLIRYSLAGDFANVWIPVIAVAVYTAAFTAAAIACFKFKGKSA